MKKTITQSMAWLHTWAGLLFGWILFGVLLSGSLAVFYQEIDFWATPEIPARSSLSREAQVDIAIKHLQDVAPRSRLWQVILPSDREPVLRTAFHTRDGGTVTHRLNPDTGEVITRDVRGGYFFYRYHYQLLIDYKKNMLGLFIVAACGITMLVASITGIVIHKHIFRDFFTFRPGSSRMRSWLDAHNILGVLPLPFHIMMAYTGLVLYYWLYIPAAVNSLYGGDFATFRHDALVDRYQELKVAAGHPASLHPVFPLIEKAEDVFGPGAAASFYVRDPNKSDAVTEIWRTRTDQLSQRFFKVTYNGVTGQELHRDVNSIPAVRIQSTLAALHWIEWGGPVVRWIYFLCGIAGAVTAATGLVLFAIKRERYHKEAAFTHVVRVLNIASVSGFCIACTAFMWVERLAPYNATDRDLLVDEVFFAVWALTFVHAILRRTNKAWVDQFVVAGILCLLLPITGWVVNRNLLGTLRDQDWIRSGVDLSAIGIGIGFLVLAVYLNKKIAWTSVSMIADPKPS
jgi:uncharacterized iron-regulated membrane protein